MNLTHSYQTLPDTFYKKVAPANSKSPNLLLFNKALADALNIDINKNVTELTNWFSGNILPDTASPIAQAYAGHQFGQLSMLGDGRAILLGEINTNDGLVDIQLKGSGMTPYSRGGDGKATLSAMLREYIISEAMYALDIPTTRSLAVVTTGETIFRNKQQRGAILTRTASSHIRVGTFVYASILDVQAKQSNSDNTKALLDYTVNRHYPELNELATRQKALELLDKVIFCQAKLIANWQRVGFIHGVMNTDNVTISGETIDYGPCAFMDAYDDKTVFSSIDYQGRYAYKNQMPIMWWNMARFAECLIPLIDNDHDKASEKATEVLNKFGEYFNTEWTSMLCAKVGLVANDSNKTFANELLAIMQNNQYDFTNTFKDLTHLLMQLNEQNPNKENSQKELLDKELVKNVNETLATNNESFEWLVNWYKKIVNQASKNGFSVQDAVNLMQLNNPVVIPRNHLVENALTKAEDGDMSDFETLLAAVQHPYSWQQQDTKTKQCFYEPAAKEWNDNYKTYCGT